MILFRGPQSALSTNDTNIRYAETSNVTFQDVKGIDSCKQELEELVGFLQNPKIFHDSGARLPKGILLTGRPGTGKTLMAKAIAGESKVKFFYSSGSEFEEVFVGVGARRIRSLFAAAKEQAPCIIFIDELDSLGGKRKSQAQMESRQALNQLLVEMDGFQPTENVIVVAATNFPEALDSALKRPGRFDKTIEVPIPDYQGRLEILEFYLSKIAHSQTIQKEIWARKTIGMTGADIQNLVNMAILEAVKQGREEASNQDIEVAFDRITLGVDFRNKLMTKEQKENTAIHEAGHVLASLLTEGAKKIHKATILPRGPSLGATHFIPDQEELNHTRMNIIAEIDVQMGGRAAEEIIYGIDKVTNGSSSDLKKATDYAYFALQNGLFNEHVGLASGISFENMGAQQRDLIDQQCSIVLLDAYERTKQKLLKNKIFLQKLADQLLEKETLTEKEISEFTCQNKLKE